jgi:hypothetical protein
MEPYAYPEPRPTPELVSRLPDPVHRSEVESVYRNASLLDRQLDALLTWFHRASRGERMNLGVCFELYLRTKDSLLSLCACGILEGSFEEIARMLPEPPFPDLVHPGFDLRLMSWVYGWSVPTSGQGIVVAGLDPGGLLHIRVFDFACQRTDTYETMEGGITHLVRADASGNVVSDVPETSLPSAQTQAISSLKPQLQPPGLLPPHVLSDAETDMVLSEMTSITGQTLDQEPASSPEAREQFEKLTGRPLRNWYEETDFFREQLRKLGKMTALHGTLKQVCSVIEQSPEFFNVPWPEGVQDRARPPVWDRMKLVKNCADNCCVYFRNIIYPITYEQYLFLDALVRAEGGTVSFKRIPGLKDAKIERVRKGLPAKILRHIKTDRTGSRLSDDVFVLRLMPWGDGSKVPASGTSLFVVGTDTGGLLHVRIFDASRKRVVDKDEKKLPGAQAAAIAALKRRLEGLMPPHVLTDAETRRVIREVTSIVGLNLDDVDN